MGKQLKKIYDCLNIGSNKKAVQEIDRFPKHVRDTTVFKALKALALIRLSKRKQALDILNEINPDEDLDEVTIQTMTSAYKELVECEKILELYEAAAKRKPNDLDIMTQLFMSYVRTFEFKRQKDIALVMRNQFPLKSRLYLSWAIMSLVMQAKDQEGQPAAGICLSLAETMFERTIDGKRSNEEIELYLSILRKQKKSQKEYEYLTEPSSLRLTDNLSWFNRRRAFLCLDLKLYSQAFKHYFPALIRDYPDQLEYYQGLMSSAFSLDIEVSSQTSSSNTDQQSSQANGTPVKTMPTLAECYEIVERQCWLKSEFNENAKDSSKSKNRSIVTSPESSNPKSSLRGPFMARAELYYRLTTNEGILPKNVLNMCLSPFSAKFPDLNSILVDYFKNFSRKTTCFYDMCYMMNHFKLSYDDKQTLVNSISEWIKSFDNSHVEMSTSDRFHTALNYDLLKEFLHKYHSSDKREDRIVKAKAYLDVYDQNKHLAKNATKTEPHVFDHYCLLAINSIMTNSVPSGNISDQTILDDSLLITLIVIAENAILTSPANHKLKLTLLKLYSFIGASKRCSEILVSLDIKHFQIDTLGHLLNPVLYNTGHYTISKESLDTCTEFYAHNVRECLEGLTTSYRDGRFSKIEEISGVLRRLNDSLNASQCFLLKGVVTNLMASNAEELTNASQSFDPYSGLHRMFRNHETSPTIRDNRDFKVLRCFNEETNNLVSKRQCETLGDDKIWLKMRYFLMRGTYLQYELATEKLSNDAKDTILKELQYSKGIIADMWPTIEELSAVKSDENYCYLEPEPSPFKLSFTNFKMLISFVNELIFIADASSFPTTFVEDYTNKLDNIITSLEGHLSNKESLVGMKQVLLSLTFTLEIISIATTCLFSFSQTQAKTKSISNQLINKTEARLIRLSAIIKNIDPKQILDKIVNVDLALLPDRGSEPVETALAKVKEKIAESYTESLAELEALCKRKIKLFKS